MTIPYPGSRPGRARTAAVMALLLAVIGLQAMLPQSAQADDGGYPWANATTLNASTYDWGYADCPTDNTGCKSITYPPTNTYGQADPWGNYLRNCTSYAAWKLSSLGVSSVKFQGLGNGGQWATNAAGRDGVTVNTTPAYGAAAVNTTAAPPYGHVSIVKSVNGNGTITLSEYNYGTSGGYGERTGTPAALGVSKFVHFGVTPSTSTPTGNPRRNTSDLLGDGNDDIVLVTHDADGATGINIGASTGNGFWMKPQWLHDPYTNWADVVPMVGDVSGDGKADYVYLLPSANGTQAWVLTSTGSTFNPAQLWWNGAGWGFAGIKPALGDVNGDGSQDLVLVTRGANNATGISVGIAGSGGFAVQPQWWNDPYTDWTVMKPLVGDVTGDKVADVTYLIPTASGSAAYVVPSGKTGFHPTQLWWNGAGYQFDAIKPVMGDINGDGNQDLLLATRRDDGGTTLSAALSTNDVFWLQQPWWTDQYTDWAAMKPFAGRFVGGAVYDFGFLVPTPTGSRAWVLRSNGTSLQAPQSWWADGWGFGGIKLASR